MKRRMVRTRSTDAGTSLAAFLARELGSSIEEARTRVLQGAVYIQGRRQLDPATLLRADQTVSVVLEEGGRSTLESVHSKVPDPEIIFEDESLLIIHKPAGAPSQPTAARVGNSIQDWIQARNQGFAGLVHRLDRDTSGVMVFGKTKKATQALAAEFRLSRAKKRYLAVCGPGLPPGGLIDLPISPDPSRPGRYRASGAANGAPAETRFARLYSHTSFSLVELFPLTGRTHQLRAHLTALRCPIAGDERYGGAERVEGVVIARTLLHARSLSLHHPVTGKSCLWEADLPPDMAVWFETAGIPVPTGSW